jgi:hypothetical protein
VPDARDRTTWVALELTKHGDKLVEEGSFEREIRKLLGISPQWPVFIPAKAYIKKGRRVTVHLMEGYAFVASGLEEIAYFRLDQTKFIEGVMATKDSRGLKVLATISDDRIKDLRRRLSEEVASDLAPGMLVFVNDGIYTQLEGTVLDTEGDYAVVRFALRSLEVISKVPKVFLDAM